MAIFKTPKDYKNDVRHASHNLSCIKTTTMHPGIIYPIYSRKVLAGDKVTLDLSAILKSNPLQAQLFSSFKLKIAVFFDSDSNYYGWLDNNNKLSVSDLINRTRHSVSYRPGSNTTAASRLLVKNSSSSVPAGGIISKSYGNGTSSLMDFAGLPVGAGSYYIGNNYQTYSMDIGFVLTYLNIVRNYYANNQQENIPYITSITNTVNNYSSVKLSVIDNLMMLLRLQTNGVNIDLSESAGSFSFPVSVNGSDSPYNGVDTWLFNYLSYCFNPYGGLFLDTYLPDEWTNTLNMDSQQVSSTVTTTDGSFTIDTLRFQNKLQAWIDRLFVSGGRFKNWLRTVWGVTTSKDMDIPQLIGVAQSYLNPSPVVATATGSETDLGQQGGSFNGSLSMRKFSFKASTPGRVMICVSLIPCVEYCQGIDPELVQTNFSDEYNPEFANLGLQNVPRMFYSIYPNLNSSGISTQSTFNNILDSAVGKQVAWVHYMTDVNRCHGEFATGGIYDYWVLQRRYTRPSSNILPSSPGGIQPTSDNTILFSFTQYINPLDFQYPFVSQTLADPNWQFQLGVRGKWYRPVGKHFMPTFGR